MLRRAVASLALVCALLPVRVDAAVLTIDFSEFEGIDLFDSLGDFYDGGTNSLGVQGPDYGITSNAAVGYFWDETVLMWEDGPSGDAVIHVEGGFTDGFAFRYASTTDVQFSVAVFDINGQVLASVQFMSEGTGLQAPWNWSVLGLEFDGVGYGVRIGDSQPTGLGSEVLDNLTFGSATLVPAPASVWLLVSGIVLARRLLKRSGADRRVHIG